MISFNNIERNTATQKNVATTLSISSPFFKLLILFSVLVVLNQH